MREQVPQAVGFDSEPLSPILQRWGLQSRTAGFSGDARYERLIGGAQRRSVVGNSSEIALDFDQAPLREARDDQFGGVARDVLGQARAQRARRHAGPNRFGAVVGVEVFEQAVLEAFEYIAAEPAVVWGRRDFALGGEHGQRLVEVDHREPRLASEDVALHTAETTAPDQHDESLRRFARRESREVAPDFGIAAAPTRR